MELAKHPPLGIVVQAEEVWAPIDRHLERRSQDDGDNGLQAPRPFIDWSQRGRRPVECIDTSTHLRTVGQFGKQI